MVATITLAAGCGGSGSGALPQPAQLSAPAERRVADQVRADVDHYLAGMDQIRAVLVYHDGEPILERYVGTTPQAYWNVHSVTKSVMSALIGIAIEQGRIKGIDQTLGELLPNYAEVMTPEVASITLRQVLTHSGGFATTAGDVDPRTDPDWIRTILTYRDANDSGDSFVYSNPNAHLLSAILTEATGQSVLDFARGALFDPLGIPSRPAFEQFGLPGEPGFHEFTSGYLTAGFAWPVDPTGINIGADTLKLRPQDLATLGLLYLNHGRWGERQIIPASWVKESTAAQVDRIGSGDANGYGYMWWVTTVDHDPAYAAVGFGGQMLEVIPNRNLVVVIATEIAGEDPDNADPSQPAWGWTLVENAIAPHFT